MNFEFFQKKKKDPISIRKIFGILSFSRKANFEFFSEEEKIRSKFHSKDFWNLNFSRKANFIYMEGQKNPNSFKYEIPPQFEATSSHPHRKFYSRIFVISQLKILSFLT